MKNVSYYFVSSENASLGVEKKIKGMLFAFNELGYTTNCCKVNNKISGFYLMCKNLFNDSSKLIFVRYHLPWMPVLFFIFCYLRARGKKIIIDIPTPRVIFLREILDEKNSALKKYLKYFIVVFSGSWVLFPASLVTQYAPESLWFELGVGRKTLLMGNGVHIDKTVPLAQLNADKEQLRLIAIAQFAFWHGYDRLIKAISQLPERYQEKIRLTMVGDGSSYPEYKDLVQSLGLQSKVVFLGKLSGVELDEVFDNQDFGIGSLALFRKGLDVAAELKTREYIARGLPIIAAGKDVDFVGDELFRIEVSNDEDIESIKNTLIYLIDEKISYNANTVREFAVKKLSFESKVKKILSELGVLI